MLPEVGKAQEPLCLLTAGSVPVTPGEGWHEQDVQHLLKYPFLCKTEAKNADLPQPDLPWSPQHPQLGPAPLLGARWERLWPFHGEPYLSPYKNPEIRGQ